MRTIFAEYNPQRNSIDIYFTDVGRCRRFIRVIKCMQPVCFITHRLLNQIYYN